MLSESTQAPQWLGNHSALGSWETANVCPALGLFLNTLGLILCSYNWMVGAGCGGSLKLAGLCLIHRSILQVWIEKNPRLWVESRQNTALCSGSDWHRAAGGGENPKEGVFQGAGSDGPDTPTVMEVLELRCLQWENSCCLGGRVAQQRVEALAAAPGSVHCWIIDSLERTGWWSGSSLRFEEQHTSTSSQLWALSHWWLTAAKEELVV